VDVLITVVLIKPRLSGNVGAICRVMKNFGFDRLVLISPVCNPKSNEARKRAKHAQDVLESAKVKSIEWLKKFDCLIGTTGKLGGDYNIPRSPLKPKQFSEIVVKKKCNIGLVFGPERYGLTNNEIAMCDFVVSIPTSPKYPIMNLSQSAAVLLYELFQHGLGIKTGEQIAVASKKDKDVLLGLIDKTLNKVKFATSEKKKTQKTIWKKIVGKSFLTKREVFGLCGYFRKFL